MYFCSLCNKSGGVTDFLYIDNVCNGCTPKSIYHCIECKKNTENITDFLYSNDVCNRCTPPMYHCIGCKKSTKYRSDFIHSEKFCNKCIPNSYREEGLLSVLRKWPTTMAIIIFQELSLEGIINLNIFDFQDFLNTDDFTKNDEEKYV